MNFHNNAIVFRYAHMDPYIQIKATTKNNNKELFGLSKSPALQAYNCRNVDTQIHTALAHKKK